MRSVVSEGGPGLLLFDEPSASLDPTAEHGVYLHTISSSPVQAILPIL
jgi:ABC-type polar amino acid transport system ATPase subunit